MIELRPGDVAIILHEDDEVDLFLPALADEDDVSDTALIATALALRIDDPLFRQEMIDFALRNKESEPEIVS